MKKMFVVLAVVLVLVGSFVVVARTWTTPEPTSYVKYVVKSGDTLWEIAEESDMWGKLDTKTIIEDIKDKSDCTSSIHPGQVLCIPMYND